MKNILKKKIKSGDKCIGSWLQISNQTVAEILAKSGLDWLAIDMEHSSIGINELEPLIQTIFANDCVPLVRLPENDPMLAKRIMDIGACGIIVPMVNNKQEAEKAVKSIKYPPMGSRGVGLYRAQEFGNSFEQYFKKNNSESLVIVQIESKEGVENIEEIVSVKGLDGVFIGPYDLSCSLGVAGQLDHELVNKARERVARVVKKAGLVIGTHVVHPSSEELKIRIKEGYKFIAYSTDAILLNHYFRELVNKIKNL